MSVTNENFLSPLGYRFVMKRAPHINYFVQKVSIPTVSLGTASIATPFVDIPTPGTKLTFGLLRVDFKVDEDMNNYLEIFNWLVGLGFPDNFGQHRALAQRTAQQGDSIYSDITLTVMNSTMNPNKQIIFKDCYPVDLGEVSLDSTATDVAYVTSSVSFAYRSFTVEDA